MSALNQITYLLNRSAIRGFPTDTSEVTTPRKFGVNPDTNAPITSPSVRIWKNTFRRARLMSQAAIQRSSRGTVEPKSALWLVLFYRSTIGKKVVKAMTKIRALFEMVDFHG